VYEGEQIGQLDLGKLLATSVDADDCPRPVPRVEIYPNRGATHYRSGDVTANYQVGSETPNRIIEFVLLHGDRLDA
jgi:hypothetical protein